MNSLKKRFGGRVSPAHIVSVSTANFGASGPIRRFFAVAVASQDEAVRAVGKRIKANENAVWIEARSLSLAPGEVREI